MGLSVFPAPSSGIQPSQLITEPVWTLISSSQGGAATITFSNIPTTYRKLILVLVGLTNNRTDAVGRQIGIRVNGDDTNNYAYITQSLNAGTSGWNNYAQSNNNNSMLLEGSIPSSDQNAQRWLNAHIEIGNASNTERIKPFNIRYWNRDTSGTMQHRLQNGHYKGSGATITSLTLFLDSDSLSTATAPNGIYLYGAN